MPMPVYACIICCNLGFATLNKHGFVSIFACQRAPPGFVGNPPDFAASPAAEITISWCQNPSIFTAWWYTYPSEKYESQLGLLFPIYGKRCSKPPTSSDLLVVKGPLERASRLCTGSVEAEGLVLRKPQRSWGNLGDLDTLTTIDIYAYHHIYNLVL
jgi:hypothetical protein